MILGLRILEIPNFWIERSFHKIVNVRHTTKIMIIKKILSRAIFGTQKMHSLLDAPMKKKYGISNFLQHLLKKYQSTYSSSRGGSQGEMSQCGKEGNSLSRFFRKIPWQRIFHYRLVSRNIFQERVIFLFFSTLLCLGLS